MKFAGRGHVLLQGFLCSLIGMVRGALFRDGQYFLEEGGGDGQNLVGEKQTSSLF